MKLEDTIFTNSLPVNTIPVLSKLSELLKEHKTNSLCNEELKEDTRFDKLLILLILQRFNGILPNLNDLFKDLKMKLDEHFENRKFIIDQ